MTHNRNPSRQYQSQTPKLSQLAHNLRARNNEIDLIHIRMILFLAFAVFVGVILSTSNIDIISADQSDKPSISDSTESLSAQDEKNETFNVSNSIPVRNGLSKIFTKEVKNWKLQILAWSELHGVDPDVIAILMQIESCGDPLALSSAGARGLFQVMPFHFSPGEDSFDPNTNALRGLQYFADRLVQTNGDIGRAFAGYNGGHVAAAGSWNSWFAETQSYYIWATGLYSDAKAGLKESPTLQRWLSAGGASLCHQAAERLEL